MVLFATFVTFFYCLVCISTMFFMGKFLIKTNRNWQLVFGTGITAMMSVLMYPRFANAIVYQKILGYALSVLMAITVGFAVASAIIIPITYVTEKLARRE